MSCEEVRFLRDSKRFQVQVFPCGRLLGSGSLPTDLDQGTTLLVTATLKFVETVALNGKLSVRAMNALEGPCLAFESDAVVAASAELHFTNCHNTGEDVWRDIPDVDLMQISALDGEAAEVDGGAMNVRGNLMVMGTLIIRDCRAHENGGSLGSNMVACLQELMMEGPKWLICGFRMPLVTK